MHLMLLAKVFFHFHAIKKKVMFPCWKYFQLFTVKQEVKSTTFRGYIFDQKSSFHSSSNFQFWGKTGVVTLWEMFCKEGHLHLHSGPDTSKTGGVPCWKY